MIDIQATRVVLLVEDDPLVRLTITEALDGAGFLVLIASNASEALTILEARPDVAAIVSDIDMPGPLNGLSLAWEVASRWPSTPMLLISGLGAPTPAMMPSGIGYLGKPASMDRLVATVRDMLGPDALELVERRAKDPEPEG